MKKTSLLPSLLFCFVFVFCLQLVQEAAGAAAAWLSFQKVLSPLALYPHIKNNVSVLSLFIFSVLETRNLWAICIFNSTIK